MKYLILLGFLAGSLVGCASQQVRPCNGTGIWVTAQERDVPSMPTLPRTTTGIQPLAMGVPHAITVTVHNGGDRPAEIGLACRVQGRGHENDGYRVTQVALQERQEKDLSFALESDPYGLPRQLDCRVATVARP